jgi:hypothetical protein
MARESRPPGFDMSYRPQGRQSFGPPVRTWVLPASYLVVAILFAGVVAAAYTQTSGGWLFRYIVEGDQHRVVGAKFLALFVVLGGVAAVARTGMRGVVVHADGIEARDVVNFAWPKVKNCTWAEIDEFVFEGKSVGLRLWDGDRLWLPQVLDQEGLRRAVERVAVARGIPLRGETRPKEEVEAEIDEMGGAG